MGKRAQRHHKIWAYRQGLPDRSRQRAMHTLRHLMVNHATNTFELSLARCWVMFCLMMQMSEGLLGGSRDLHFPFGSLCPQTKADGRCFAACQGGHRMHNHSATPKHYQNNTAEHFSNLTTIHTLHCPRYHKFIVAQAAEDSGYPMTLFEEASS